jgi:hypothetical protein
MKICRPIFACTITKSGILLLLRDLSHMVVLFYSNTLSFSPFYAVFFVVFLKSIESYTFGSYPNYHRSMKIQGCVLDTV